MSAPIVEGGDAPVTDDFDVIAACQLWLELDFPDQSITDHSEIASAEKGDPR